MENVAKLLEDVTMLFRCEGGNTEAMGRSSEEETDGLKRMFVTPLE